MTKTTKLQKSTEPEKPPLSPEEIAKMYGFDEPDYLKIISPDVYRAWTDLLQMAQGHSMKATYIAGRIFSDVLHGLVPAKSIPYAFRLCIKTLMSEFTGHIDNLLFDIDTPTAEGTAFNGNGFFTDLKTVREMSKYDSIYSENLRSIVVLLDCLHRSQQRRCEREYYNSGGLDTAIQYIRDYCIKAEMAIAELSIRADIPIERPDRPGRNGGRPFYIEIDRPSQTLTIGGISKRFTGKTWAALMYLIDKRRQRAGATPIVTIDGKKHDIKNVQTILGRHFPKMAGAIIEQREGLFYLGAGVQIIDGGQVGIRSNTQRPISRNDLER